MEKTIELIPLNPSIGAEVVGVDLARANPSQLEDIKTAFSRHKVLVFRDQSLNAEQHKAFARNFGPLHIHPRYSHLGAEGDPELFIINTHADSKYSNGEAWHSDVSCDPVPPMASLLYVEQPPPDGGGDTLFANMCEAYAALSPSMKQWLLGLQAEHDGRKDLAAYNVRLGPEQSYHRVDCPGITKHLETGAPILFVNRSFTSKILGLDRGESEAALEMLCAHIESNPRWQCRVRWSPRTLVMWDNRCTQHHAVWDYYPHSRYARRVTVRCTDAPTAYLGSGAKPAR